MKTVSNVSVLGVRMIQKATNSKSGGDSNFTYKSYNLMSNGHFHVGEINCGSTKVRMREVDFGDSCFEALVKTKKGKSHWTKVSCDAADKYIERVLEHNNKASEIHAQFEENRPLIVLTPEELV